MENQDIFKKAQQHLQNKLPFVLYRKGSQPNETEFTIKAFFQKDDQLHTTTRFSESGFVMGAFDLSSRPSPFIPSEESEMMESRIPAIRDFVPQETERKMEDPEIRRKHIELVEKGIEFIVEGKGSKVVLSRKLEAKKESDPLEIYQSLLNLYPTAFAYLWYHPKVGMWTGATPETLLKVKGHQLFTMALAGTKAAKDAPTPQWTSKEINEQQYVTDFIADTLKDKVSHLSIGQVNNIRAGKLWHLKCDINATLKSTDHFKEVLEALHPTPAVCGMPKEETMRFIQEQENYDRSFYTGFIGELHLQPKKEDEKQTELFVNLRCMQIHNQTCEIYVGGGIVIDSNPESEWEETVNKSMTMLDVLQAVPSHYRERFLAFFS